jgi:hypothetical protein
MMFRDIVRGVCGACCAAVMMCASGVLGMDSHNESSADTMAELAYKLRDSNLTTFNSRIVNIPYPTPSEWQESFKMIEEGMAILSSFPEYWVMRFIKSSIIAFPCRFLSFADFCSSEFFDEESRARVIMFLTLCKRAFAALPHNHSEHVVKEFKSIIQDRSKYIEEGLGNVICRQSSLSLVLTSDAPLFEEMSRIMWSSFPEER